jgi:hypothetical protein
MWFMIHYPSFGLGKERRARRPERAAIYRIRRVHESIRRPPTDIWDSILVRSRLLFSICIYTYMSKKTPDEKHEIRN